ncbi:diguanylate cyclase (GGDEF) domain-containing protein [Anaerobranca californiensis DSM 14826]|jgi:diguanylate cyclase (GGDEF)-like protein|uniref:Diguanylate cyclase (GGDEF) domain-containing protein n=1 Tax=Anaerobranca californiensis DSM 14826 TaxID=1120989 RepID=A0A1M6MK52_9FIRM|nr:sensor domain-containing diguanylate cyclase [Anaerobranca californiensis]SHJ83740.1 diguanylate cyclase (GGDEF) domain-containing protein [Anaerobranca californiensis DSM 14826]
MNLRKKSVLNRQIIIALLFFSFFIIFLPILIHFIFFEDFLINKAFIRIFLSSIIFTFIIIFIFHLWVKRNIIAPIEKLQKGTTEVIKGNLNYDFTVDVNNDLAFLGENLNKMVKTIYKQQKELEELVRTDPLTGLANRRHFDQQLELEIERCKRKGTPLSLLVCDIDDFKCINDTYGHLLGDTVLVELGSLFITNLRKTDLPSRFGGEEFVILLPDTPLEKAIIVANKLLEEVKKLEFDTPDGLLSISITIGVASSEQIPDFDIIPDPKNILLENGDKALYRGKYNGKNQVCK